MVEARMSNTRKPATVPTDRTPEKKKDQRDTVVDRRCGLDRRDFPETAGELTTNLERRRGPGRRRTDFMKSVTATIGPGASRRSSVTYGVRGASFGWSRFQRSTLSASSRSCL